MAEGVLEYLAPWRRGQPGVVVTNDAFPKSPDYDVVELHNHGVPEQDGDRTYPWVLGTMFEQQSEPVAKTLSWLINHVDDDGVLMIELPYPEHKPSDILGMITMAVPNVWVISDELRDGHMLLVLKAHRPAKDANLTFYIENRAEVGDTLSLIPLMKQLHKEWPNCTIFIREDRHGLCSQLATPCERIKTWVDGVLYQETRRNQFGDFYRRVDDFYLYPMRLAQLLDWIEEPLPDQPEVPKIFGNLSPKVRGQLYKRSKSPYVVVAPQTNFSPREWGDERWKHVIRWLLESGLKVVVVGNRKFTMDAGTMQNKLIDLTTMTDIQDLGTVIKDAQLVLGCDSAPIHLAMGHGVRTLVLQGPTAAAPLFRYDKVRSILRRDRGCTNCFQKVLDSTKPYSEGEQPKLYTCGEANPIPCMRCITVTQVIDVLRNELSQDNVPPTLSICMMVKNEEEPIGEALKSALPAADEIIVLDTGSTDKTEEICLSFNKDKEQKVQFIKHTGAGFKNGKICDFAAVRNVAFDLARSKYVMWLDAGDRIEKPEVLRAAVLAETLDVINMPTVFGDATYLRERVGPRGFIKFVDRVHETMDITGLSNDTIGCNIKHVGTKKVNREGSLERNIRLLKQMITEAPECDHRFRWFYYVARDLKQGGKPAEALPYFYQARDGNGFWEERAHSAVEIGRAYMEMKDYNKSLIAGFEALKVCDGWRDPYYIIGDAYYWMGAPMKAVAWFQHCLMVPRPKTILWLWEDLYTWLPQCQLSYSYEQLGRREEALLWVKEELKNAPESQQSRILSRIKTLEAKR